MWLVEQGLYPYAQDEYLSLILAIFLVLVLDRRIRRNLMPQLVTDSVLNGKTIQKESRKPTFQR